MKEELKVEDDSETDIVDKLCIKIESSDYKYLLICTFHYNM